MFLTPACLLNPDQKPFDVTSPGIGLYLEDRILQIRAIGYCGYTAMSQVVDIPDSLLLIDGVPNPHFRHDRLTPEAWWACLWPTERAVEAAVHQDWEELGKWVDLAYQAEREHLGEPSPKTDLAYATARGIGAWGGRPSCGKLALLCDPAQRKTIENAVRRVL